MLCYERNVETNARLEAAGVEVIRVPGSELGWARGGPRAMSCAVSRDSLTRAQPRVPPLTVAAIADASAPVVASLPDVPAVPPVAPVPDVAPAPAATVADLARARARLPSMGQSGTSRQGRGVS